MDKAIEKRIREKTREVWKGVAKDLDGSVDAFMAMIELVEKDPDFIADKFGEIAKLDWPSFRNQCAEDGIELTPDEAKFCFDAYQMAMHVYESAQYEEF